MRRNVWEARRRGNSLRVFAGDLGLSYSHGVSGVVGCWWDRVRTRFSFRQRGSWRDGTAPNRVWLRPEQVTGISNSLIPGQKLDTYYFSAGLSHAGANGEPQTWLIHSKNRTPICSSARRCVRNDVHAASGFDLDLMAYTAIRDRVRPKGKGTADDSGRRNEYAGLCSDRETRWPVLVVLALLGCVSRSV